MTTETTPHGTREHPEVAELSDLIEGLLPESRGEALRAHLAECPLCADVHASLTEIRGALGTLPGPSRMPDDVAGRIDAALAAEALLDTERHAAEPGVVSRETAPDEPVDVSRETRPHRRPSRPPRTSRRTTSATGPGRRARAFRHHRALLTAAGAVGALVLGGALLQGITGGSSAGGDAGSAAGEQGAADDGGALAAEGLEQRVQDLLSRSASGAEGGPDLKTETKPPSNAPLAGGPAVVPTCVRAGIDRPEQPLAAEPGQPYSGRPSYLVVLPHPGDPQRVDAYVVDSSCTTDDSGAPAEILLERTLPRD